MQEFVKYIEESVEKLEREEKMLADSDRKDEANLVKIRINIYGICKTVWQVVVQGQAKDDAGTENSLSDVYLQRMASVSRNWRVSYEKAKEYNDVEKLVIEEIKLETLEEIKRKFREICEE